MSMQGAQGWVKRAGQVCRISNKNRMRENQTYYASRTACKKHLAHSKIMINLDFSIKFNAFCEYLCKLTGNLLPKS